MKRRTHYILFAITLALTVVCGILMLHVNVNTDLTKYLPDDSQMKRGLEIVTSEFGSAQMSGTDVHVMFEGVSPKEIPGITSLLDAYPDVHGVTYRYSADSAYTVFDLDVPKSVDQKALGKQISHRFGESCVVETSQDGATPPVSVMIIAAVLIMLVLFLMAQSWFEPVVILISTLMAVVLNMGTNALLPSVSITTNFIGSILQAVLSLDYCIVLLNRYRQEQDEHTDRQTAGIAANKAVKRAAPSILSSALTTVVGLLMLCFMRLKIGADMGIVLAKGVVCSLICTFTVMPSLMLLFRKTINRTAKKAYVPPTDGLAYFVTSHKVSMAIGAVVLFFASWYFSHTTTIFFSAEKESRIEQIFPALNPFVLVYDTHEENKILQLADSLAAQPGVQTVISYPTLMCEALTPADQTRHIQSLTTMLSDMMPPDAPKPTTEQMALLSPETMQLLYYMRSAEGKPQQPMLFPDLARFLHSHCVNNPLFASYISDEMRDQVELLQSMLDMPAPEPEPEEPVIASAQPEPSEPSETAEDTLFVRDTMPVDLLVAEPMPIVTDTVVAPVIDANRIAVVPFIDLLYSSQPTPLTIEMHKLVDTIAIRLPMSVKEMSLFIGSSQIQTQLVYGYAPGKNKQMTPLQYVHLLKDDLFKRPGLAGMINEEQRRQLEQRAYLMDLADANASLTPNELNILLQSFGIDNYSDDQLYALAHPVEPAKPVEPVALTEPVKPLKPAAIALPEEIVAAVEASDESESSQLADDQQKEPEKIHHTPSREDQQAELFTELVFGEEAYSPDEMAKKLGRLMRLSGVKSAPVTADQMSLLYDYYAAVHSSCDTMRLGLDQLLVYVCDTLVYDKRLEPIIPDTIRGRIADVRTQVMDGIGQMRQPDHSLLVLLTTLPPESPETYAFVDTLTSLADESLEQEHYYVGESVMYAEMRAGFNHEMNIVTLLTILSIFLIVAITFRSLIVPTILVVTVMTAVYVNVVVSGLVAGQMLYLAYLVVQAILMGATIDYGILLANYYREYRKTMLPRDAAAAAYRGSIRTITTSGLIMVIAPAVMALLIDDLMISNIVGCIAVGASVAILLILTVVPAILVALDKWVVYGKKNRFTKPAEPQDELTTTNNESIQETLS